MSAGEEAIDEDDQDDLHLPPGPRRRTWEEMDTLRARMVQAGGSLPDLTDAENERVWRSLTSRRRRPQLQAILGMADAQIDQIVARMRLVRSVLTAFIESR